MKRTQAEDHDTCAICKDTISEPTRVEKCDHVFCFACISQWANKVSNSCPLCQQRFLHLYRIGGKKEKVKQIDEREKNWMEVEEHFDSGEASIHTSDEDSDEIGSEGDRYEGDFVVPDHVVEYKSGKIVDERGSKKFRNPFGRAPRGQEDSIIKTLDGKTISVTWSPYKSGSNDDDDDDDGEFNITKDMSTSSDDDEEDDIEEESEEEEEDDEGVKVLYKPQQKRK